MSHRVLVLFVCSFMIVLSSRGQTGSNQPSAPIAVQQPLGNGLSWSGGTAGYYGEGPTGGVFLSTPTAGFDSPLPAAGISLAARAGISNSSPVGIGVQSSLGSSTLVYSSIPAETPTVSPATAAVPPSRTVLDFGPSFYSGQIGASASSGPSLGEIAAHYRGLQPPQGIRTYTNADIRPPRNLANVENSVMAANMPPTFPQAAQRGASGTASRTTTSSAPMGASAQDSSAGGQRNIQSERLPAAATMLPLLGLFGVISTGIGLILIGRIRRSGVA